MGPDHERKSLAEEVGFKPGEYSVDIEKTAEDEVYGLLEYLCALKGLWPTVKYVDAFGDRVEIDTFEFLDLRDEEPSYRETFLKGKAYEILCGTDFEVSLVDPNRRVVSD